MTTRGGAVESRVPKRKENPSRLRLQLKETIRLGQVSSVRSLETSQRTIGRHDTSCRDRDCCTPRKKAESREVPIYSPPQAGPTSTGVWLPFAGVPPSSSLPRCVRNNQALFICIASRALRKRAVNHTAKPGGYFTGEADRKRKHNTILPSLNLRFLGGPDGATLTWGPRQGPGVGQDSGTRGAPRTVFLFDAVSSGRSTLPSLDRCRSTRRRSPGHQKGQNPRGVRSRAASFGLNSRRPAAVNFADRPSFRAQEASLLLEVSLLHLAGLSSPPASVFSAIL